VENQAHRLPTAAKTTLAVQQIAQEAVVPSILAKTGSSSLWLVEIAGTRNGLEALHLDIARCILPSLGAITTDIPVKHIGKALLLFVAIASAPGFGRAQQSGPPPRVIHPIDETARIILRGNTYPLAQPEFDTGPAPGNFPLHRVLLVLRRSPEQESALEELLEEQQDPSSPNYHYWLTPEEFGQRFGPADQDIQSVVAWLELHGLQVNRIAAGRLVIEFSATAGSLEEAFGTQIHRYRVNGEGHWANASDPQIPIALAPVVSGFVSLHDFHKQPLYRLAGVSSRSRDENHGRTAIPSYTEACTYNAYINEYGNCYAVSPYDFATIYNVLPLWNASPPIDGTGQVLAIVGRSNINLQDVNDFRSLFGLPPNPPQVFVDGPDPGLVPGDETEADLDVELSGGVAKGATIKLVVSESTETSDGVDLSALYIVDNNLAPVMSESFGECELGLGAAGNQFHKGLWQQAAAQGISVFVSTGDTGSAGCDPYLGVPPQPAVDGLQVNGLASTPYNVAVGGTDFYDFADASAYWNSVSDPTTHASAKGYVPESPWNSSCANAFYGQLGYSVNQEVNCNNSTFMDNTFTVAGSGGMSNCTAPSGQSPANCAGGYAKPVWQAGPGVPEDGKRDLPDVSLFASDGFANSFYMICESDISSSPCTLANFIGVGGTSTSSPTFAALMALVVQTTGARQGNPNPVLYELAASQSASVCTSTVGPAASCIFNDITTGSIAVPCSTGTPNCTTTNSGDANGILNGYIAGPAYDFATGLGSVNAANLVKNWGPVGHAFSVATLSLNSGNPVNITHGAPVSVAVSISPVSPEPSGDIALIAMPGGSEKGVGIFALSNGTASGSTNLLPGGSSYNVEAHYAGDSTYAPSDSNTVTVTVVPESSRTSLDVVNFNLFSGQISNSNATSLPYGSVYFLRADTSNLSGSPCFNPTIQTFAYDCPTGAVVLADNGASLGAGTYALNSQGSAEDQAINLTAGTHVFSANYGGDNSYLASSCETTLTVLPAPTTTTIVGNTSKTQVIGAPIVIYFNATTMNLGSFPVPAGGTFAVFDGTTQLAANFTVSPLLIANPNSPYGFESLSGYATTTLSGSIGPHALTVQYLGDPNYAGSTSAPFVVSTLYATQTTLASSAPSIQYGQNVTLTAQVASTQTSGPAPTGTVGFNYGSGSLGSYPVINGKAQVSTSSLPGGVLVITAVYSGDSNYASSIATLSQTVTPLSTSVSLTSSQSAVAQGMPVTFTARIVPSQTGTSPPTGSVLFTANGNSLGLPQYISNNEAQLTTTFNSSGSYQIQAVYSGDANYAASSASTNETVSIVPALTIAASPTTIFVPAPGQSGSTILTFTALNGLTGSTQLQSSMCANLPPESTCSFNPPSISFTPSSSLVPVTLTLVTTAPATAFLTPSTRRFWSALRAGGTAPIAALAFTMLVVLFRRHHRARAAIVALALCALIGTLGACGGGAPAGGSGGGGAGQPGTPAGTYPGATVTVSINGVTGSIDNLTVVVQ
jgi:subtilase family serine protease